MRLAPNQSSTNQTSSTSVNELIDTIAGNFELTDYSSPHSSFSTKDAPRSSSIKRNKPSDMIVVLDLDGTLIHTTQHACASEIPDLKALDAFAMDNMSEQAASPRFCCIHQRPQLHQFLDLVASRFQVHVFTASHQAYADAVLDYLERYNRGTYFAKRWYRQDCTTVGNDGSSLYKDLTKITSDLSRIVLVDDRMKSFRANPENGILVSEFRGNNAAFDDDELMAVWDLLCALDDDKQDVRPSIDKWYGQYTRKYLKDKDSRTSAANGRKRKRRRNGMGTNQDHAYYSLNENDTVDVYFGVIFKLLPLFRRWKGRGTPKI